MHKPYWAQVMCHCQAAALQMVAPMRRAWVLHSTQRAAAPPVVARAKDQNRKDPREAEDPSRNTPKDREGQRILAEVPSVEAAARPLQLLACPHADGCRYAHCVLGHSCSSIGYHRLSGPCRAPSHGRNFDRHGGHLGHDCGDHHGVRCGCHPVDAFCCTSVLDHAVPRPRPLAPMSNSSADSLCPATRCGFGCCPLPPGHNGHM